MYSVFFIHVTAESWRDSFQLSMPSLLFLDISQPCLRTSLFDVLFLLVLKCLFMNKQCVLCNWEDWDKVGFHVSRQGFRIQLYEDTSCLNLASFPLFLNTEEVDVARSLRVAFGYNLLSRTNGSSYLSFLSFLAPSLLGRGSKARFLSLSECRSWPPKQWRFFAKRKEEGAILERTFSFDGPFSVSFWFLLFPIFLHLLLLLPWNILPFPIALSLEVSSEGLGHIISLAVPTLSGVWGRFPPCDRGGNAILFCFRLGGSEDGWHLGFSGPSRNTNLQWLIVPFTVLLLSLVICLGSCQSCCSPLDSTRDATSAFGVPWPAFWVSGYSG